MVHSWVRACGTAAVALVLSVALAPAEVGSRPAEPSAVAHGSRLAPVRDVPVRMAPPVDVVAASLEDRVREAEGLPPRFAVPERVDMTPRNSGLWEAIDSVTSVWRLRVASPGAASLNLGFTRYSMPPGGALWIYSPDTTRMLRPFDTRDNASHGQLWTPILPADELMIEVTLPTTQRDALDLKLEFINVGYRGFDEIPLAGACNVDVVCPEGLPWQGEIPAIAVISTGGSLFCSGFMVNNTGLDRRPYFMTARHCGITTSNAASLVVYWNYQTSTCGGPRDGLLNEFQTGAFFRASYSPSDFTLLELDEAPDPSWGVSFAGWDRTGSDSSMAVTIHHPNADEKAISFEYQPTSTTSYLGTTSPGDGTHVRITDWDLGTTEPGSSGSPLFDAQHRVIGQLHGGYAACSNNSSDWYGKFSVSWTGGGTSTTRLSDWLDPSGTGAVVLDTLVAPTCDGDGVCEDGEDCQGCPSDCISAPGSAVCGDGVCHVADGEDCFTCPADCNGESGGPSGSRYCCGTDTSCSDSRCSTGGNVCSDAPPGYAYCCGDHVCEGAESTTSCFVDCASVAGCGDSLCDPGLGETPCSCPEDCGAPPADETGGACVDGVDNDCDGATDCEDAACAGGSALDADADGVHACADCDDADLTVWAAPGEAGSVTLDSAGTLSWNPPPDPGAATWTYDVLRSADPSDFVAAECLATGVSVTSAFDAGSPQPGQLASYLVRAVNGCPNVGIGPLGNTSSGLPRAATSCP